MLKKFFKSILLLLMALLTAASCTLGAAAAEDRGSISVTLHTKDKKISAGTLTLYRVAEPVFDESGEFYSPVTGFRSFKDELRGITGKKLGEPELAARLCKHAKLNAKGDPSVQTADAVDGAATVKFDGLKPGLYLVVQTKPIKGYQDIDPFLVTVPYENKMNVNAKPKFDQEEDTTNETTKPPSGGGSSGGGGKKPPLIQTGQLNWPVPVLAGSGMVLFMLGWVLVFSKRDRHDA